jgi:glycosyltransferase involved in cell wall biosynthesis
MAKPSLAIVSTYNDDADANATYAQLLVQSMADVFDVTVFDLKTKEILHKTGLHTSIADAHIDNIAAVLPNFDLVNIQCELGLYGSTISDMERRLAKLIKSSPRLLYTLHRIDTDQGDFAYVYARLLKIIRDRGNDKPYAIMTHTKREKDSVKEIFGIHNVSEYPVCYLPKTQKAALLKNKNPEGWKKFNGFDENDIIIGRFGTISSYKDHFTVIKALDLLPPNYKMVFVGGAHPYAIKPNAVDPNISGLTQFIEDRSKFRTDIAERIRFKGIVDNDDFYDALVNIDIVVVPHYETNQSASGVTSVALELGKRIITTYNFTFREYQLYYPGGFEMFDIGNYFELRDKILFPKKDVAKHAFELRDSYTPEGLCKLYEELYKKMTSAKYSNIFEAGRIESSFPQQQPQVTSAIKEDQHRLELEHAEKAFHAAVAAQNQLKLEKTQIEKSFSYLQVRYDMLVAKLKSI